MDTGGDGLALLGLDITLPHHRLLLPVGISFYTFQTLSYTIDVWRRELPVERDLVRFALFVSFFPQLVAGPIVRAADFLPQLQRPPALDDNRVRAGLVRIFRGLFKKVIFADLLANLGVDAVFANPTGYSTLELLLALYGYAYQIYNDFSGYSDIAIGSAALLGYHIPENFNRPYLSRNVREFWTRWHISLSTWLRDYLYIPLGGNRGKTTRNLMITMLLGGLWHGAALNFVLWGAYHGILLVFSRGLDRRASEKSVATPLRIAGERTLCFHLVLFGWLLFRTSGWANFTAFTGGLAELDFGMSLDPLYVVVLAAAATVHLYPKQRIESGLERLWRLPAPVQGALFAALVLFFCGMTLKSPSFIYFQF
jgi:D-alanyl-lipoteichoic acid acyltransferase DltB (MBOAT superfamily)